MKSCPHYVGVIKNGALLLLLLGVVIDAQFCDPPCTGKSFCNANDACECKVGFVPTISMHTGKPSCVFKPTTKATIGHEEATYIPAVFDDVNIYASTAETSLLANDGLTTENVFNYTYIDAVSSTSEDSIFNDESLASEAAEIHEHAGAPLDTTTDKFANDAAGSQDNGAQTNGLNPVTIIGIATLTIAIVCFGAYIVYTQKVRHGSYNV